MVVPNHRNSREESLPSLPEPSPSPLTPGLEFWMRLGFFWELNASFLPTAPGARSRELFGYPCWKRSPDSAFDNPYTPAHLPAWRRARSPDGPRDSQGQRCQKKRWI